MTKRSAIHWITDIYRSKRSCFNKIPARLLVSLEQVATHLLRIAAASWVDLSSGAAVKSKTFIPGLGWAVLSHLLCYRFLEWTKPVACSGDFPETFPMKWPPGVLINRRQKRKVVLLLRDWFERLKLFPPQKRQENLLASSPQCLCYIFQQSPSCI